MKFLNKILLIVIVLLLCCLWLKPRHPEVVEKIRTVTDTITLIEYDTVTQYEPKYITKRVVDTLYITDTVYVLREQKRYFEKGSYEVWISGFQPKLDSIKVFPKIEYKIIREQVYEPQQRWELYSGIGFNANSTAFIPQVGISLATPRNVLISANLGYYGGLFYGVSIQTKIR